MSMLFGGVKTPSAPAAPPPAPTAANTSSTALAQQQQMMLARGATANMLTGGSGLASMGQTSKTLLGQ